MNWNARPLIILANKGGYIQCEFTDFPKLVGGKSGSTGTPVNKGGDIRCVFADFPKLQIKVLT